MGQNVVVWETMDRFDRTPLAIRQGVDGKSLRRKFGRRFGIEKYRQGELTV
jgi:hypothetical protein